MTADKRLKIGLVVGEESGDFLGGALMAALRLRLEAEPIFCGVGGQRMRTQGLTSLFDIADTSVMGLTAVLKRLPLIIKRVYQTVDAVIAEDPDVLIIIDSPDFTHAVAKRVRKKAPHIPIAGYVSPSVWAWRPGRARKMKVYVDCLMALLPFEPSAHARLGGPPTCYVGHPLIERLDELRPAIGERPPLSGDRKVLLVLPGSRQSEVDRLLDDFGKTVEVLASRFEGLEIILPAVDHLAEKIRGGVKSWPVTPTVVTGVEARHAAFRRGHAALAASGTVCLELAISGVPMVVAYRVDWFFRRLKELNRVFKFAGVTSFVLPNIILDNHAIPAFLDDEIEPEHLAEHLTELLTDSAERQTQMIELTRLDEVMRLPEGQSQSQAAADAVCRLIGR